MNQMYLNDIDLMKFEHSICSDLDIFMIECFDDYYYTEAEAKEGIFAKIKRKIKEIFEKLKAIFRGNKVKQMDKNIEMAQKAVQNMSSEQKSKKVEVFDGEKALKLIEEDHEKAKKDPKHKRLDKKKLIALCTIPVAIGVTVGILIKNKKVLSKILHKEQELTNDLEKQEKLERQKFDSNCEEAKRKNPDFDSDNEHKMKSRLDNQPARPDLYKSDWKDSDFLADNPDCGINLLNAARDKIKLKKYVSPDAYKYSKNDKDDITIDGEYIKNIVGNVAAVEANVYSESLKTYVGVYTAIIDGNTGMTKEIIEFYNKDRKREMHISTRAEADGSVFPSSGTGMYNSKFNTTQSRRNKDVFYNKDEDRYYHTVARDPAILNGMITNAGLFRHWDDKK